MKNSIGFIICSIFYSLLLCFLVSKKGKKNLGEKNYFILVVINFICLVLEISNYYTVRNIESVKLLNLIISKLYLIGLFTWSFVFKKQVTSEQETVSEKQKKN